MMMIWSQPAARASSTPYWIMGLSTSGSISLGCALVAGRNRVPRPAAGKTALRTIWGTPNRNRGLDRDANIQCQPSAISCSFIGLEAGELNQKLKAEG